jgi:electron transport complex protein RnfC
MSTYKGGIHLPEFKGTAESPIERMPLPKQAVVLLSQHIGAPAKPIIKVGDMVKTGQLIAEAVGKISANIHAPLSGTVSAIELHHHPNGTYCDAIVIDSDGFDTTIDFKSSNPAILTPTQMIEMVKAAGIVGMGGAGFPTHIKLDPPKDKPIDSIIINGCECEPYLTCDHRVMLEEALKIIAGLELIMKMLRIDNAYIAIEDNKQDVYNAYDEILPGSGAIKLVKLKTKYPQGSEKQLISALLKRKVPSGKLPLDIGCVVQNIQTVKAVFEAIQNGKPLYERVLTVAGHVQRPVNLAVRIGTPLAELIEYCGGITSEAKRIIAGGPMMGVAQSDLDSVIVKATSGLLVLTDKEARSYEASNCIRCGRCIDTCSMHMAPTLIARLVELGRYDELAELNPLDCIECSCCAYECPAKIPLVQHVRTAKTIQQNADLRSVKPA